MKTLLILLVLVLPVLAQSTVKKPVRPVVPSKAQPAANPTAKIEGAVKAKVAAHYKDRVMGSNGLRVGSVTVKIARTEPVSGWAGRWRCSGEATLNLVGGARDHTDRKPVRSFDATVTVSESGAVESVEVSGS
jgi:hypothetical protein